MSTLKSRLICSATFDDKKAITNGVIFLSTFEIITFVMVTCLYIVVSKLPSRQRIVNAANRFPRLSVKLKTARC